jgi:hypothetical protein
MKKVECEGSAWIVFKEYNQITEELGKLSCCFKIKTKSNLEIGFYEADTKTRLKETSCLNEKQKILYQTGF